MARKELSVAPRQVAGKKVAQLRRDGILPGNVYGRGLDSVSIQIDLDAIEGMIKAATANEVIDLKVEGERVARPVVIHKIQRHPLGRGLIHADFYQVSLREKMHADVPLLIVGKAPAVETYNGTLLTAIETVQVECLPLDIPTHIEVDVSSLKELEAGLFVRDLVVPASVLILTDPDVAVVKVASPRVSTEEGEEAPAAATAVAGEEPATEAADEEKAGDS